MAQHYAIHHALRFRYNEPVRESLFEVRLQPRSEGMQRLVSFSLQTRPRAQIFAYSDHQGNTVYHFNVPRAHGDLVVVSDSIVEVAPIPVPKRIEATAWEILRNQGQEGENWDYLQASPLVGPEAGLALLLKELKLKPLADPLSSLHKLAAVLAEGRNFKPGMRSEVSLGEVLAKRKGDSVAAAHLMLAVARAWGIPSRFVTGYLVPAKGERDRGGDLAHGWMESWLPKIGWTGFDPTLGVATGSRHISVACGRDRSDVPVTRGVYKGEATQETVFSVTIKPVEPPSRAEDLLRIVRQQVRPDRGDEPGARSPNPHPRARFAGAD